MLPTRLVFAATAVLFLASCGRHVDRDRERARSQQQQDEHSAAFKAGRAAHEIAKGTAKVAAAAGRKLEESARKAHAGWKEQAAEDRRKKLESRP